MSCAAHQRKKLEHLCRYITRPAIANGAAIVDSTVIANILTHLGLPARAPPRAAARAFDRFELA